MSGDGDARWPTSAFGVFLALPLASLAFLRPAHRPAETPSTPAAGYRVGPGDVLEVAVAGRPDLSQLSTIQTTGVIHLPALGEVAVADQTTAEIATRLQALFSRSGVSAPVSVSVREYQSRSVWVAGEVRRPGRKALRGAGRLVDALIAGGGFTPDASGVVTVERRNGTFPDGTTVRRFRFANAQTPTPEDRESLSLLLRPGDLVVAGVKQYVLVQGEVRRPGRYLLEESMTVARALAAAGGLTSLSSPKVVVKRASPIEGEPAQIEVDTRTTGEDEQGRVTLRPDDAVVARPRSR
jgi:polysaccharide export outer membrane protein